MESFKKHFTVTTIINLFFLVILNVLLAGVIGYLTLDNAANLNSRLGAILVSFFVSYFIVTKTPSMHGLERMLKFGLAFLVYLIIAVSMIEIPPAVTTGFIPALLICLATLFYGNKFFGGSIRSHDTSPITTANNIQSGE